MINIHGELTADGKSIVLMSAGDELPIHAAKQVEMMTPLIKASDPKGALIMPTSWAGVVQMAMTFGSEWRPGPRLTEWIRDEVKRRTAHGTLDYPNATSGFSEMKPFPWQAAGAVEVASIGRVLIHDDVGTGKTGTAILGLVERAERDTDVFPVLCVVPANAIDGWIEEWATWAPDIRAVAWRTPEDTDAHDGPRTRAEIDAAAQERRGALIGTADVYVVSYDVARRDAPPSTTRGGKKARPLLHLGHQSLVIDEVHRIKNPKTEWTRAVHRIADVTGGDTVVGLSGTPVTHGPGDYWSALRAMEGLAWPSKERMVARYVQTRQGDYREEEIGLMPHTEPEFRTVMLGQMRRISMDDALPFMPPKVYSTRSVQLPPDWRKAYDDMESVMLAELPDDGGELPVMTTLAKMTRLSQLSSAAADVREVEKVKTLTYEQAQDLVKADPLGHGITVREGLYVQITTGLEVTLKNPSWKVDAMMELLEERRGQRQAVVFAPSRQLIMLAGVAATEAGFKVGYIVGGQAAGKRTATQKAFQAGELDVIVATTGAGGEAITLTAASTEIFLQRPWSIKDSIQAEGRARRIGSERHSHIEIIDVIAANTIDARVRAVLRERARPLSELLQDPRIVAELLGGASVTPIRQEVAS